MSESRTPVAGTIGWHDLTVDDAERLRDFYADVVGWTHEPADLGDYNDFTMFAPGTGDPVGGVCHARGSNAGFPAQWLMYVNVDDIDQSVARCAELGGKAVTEIKTMDGHGRYCVIQDPAGAVIALFQPSAT